MMVPEPDRYILSCDWGTSSFRLSLVDTKTNKLLGNISNSEGIKIINDRWNLYSGNQRRFNYFISFLNKYISQLKDITQRKLDGLPVIISGMASSSIGIKELPYRTLPLTLNKPDLIYEKFEASGDFQHELYLLSGLKSTDDVMRGEETELIGLAASHNICEGIIILPGTHSKHVYVLNNAINKFRTYLTGELFDLLVRKSILANSVSSPENFSTGSGFIKGVEASLSEHLLHAFFEIRAKDLLHQSSHFDNYEFLSGLLIGYELSDLDNEHPGKIIIAGQRPVKQYYTTACDYLELNYFETESAREITPLAHRIILNYIRNKN